MKKLNILAVLCAAVAGTVQADFISAVKDAAVQEAKNQTEAAVQEKVTEVAGDLNAGKESATGKVTETINGVQEKANAVQAEVEAVQNKANETKAAVETAKSDAKKAVADKKAEAAKKVEEAKKAPGKAKKAAEKKAKDATGKAVRGGLKKIGL